MSIWPGVTGSGVVVSARSKVGVVLTTTVRLSIALRPSFGLPLRSVARAWKCSRLPSVRPALTTGGMRTVADPPGGIAPPMVKRTTSRGAHWRVIGEQLAPAADPWLNESTPSGIRASMRSPLIPEAPVLVTVSSTPNVWPGFTGSGSMTAESWSGDPKAVRVRTRTRVAAVGSVAATTTPSATSALAGATPAPTCTVTDRRATAPAATEPRSQWTLPSMSMPSSLADTRVTSLGSASDSTPSAAPAVGRRRAVN